MPSLGPAEIMIVAAVIFLLFGVSRLPDAAKSLGRSIREFKGEMNELKKDEQEREMKQLPPVDGSERRP